MSVVLLLAVPPAPVQETEYVVFVVGETLTEPDVWFPVAKFVPVQLVALLDDQVRVED